MPTTSKLPAPYRWASDGLCVYAGDVDPIEGGCWYDPKTWAADDYASALRVSTSEERGHLLVWVERITINKPRDIRPALECCGMVEIHAATTTPERRTQIEIECCLDYGHTDPDRSDWREPHAWAYVLRQDRSSLREVARIHDAVPATSAAILANVRRIVRRGL